jgi:hypothetical protein
MHANWTSSFVNLAMQRRAVRILRQEVSARAVTQTATLVGTARMCRVGKGSGYG